MLQGSGVENLTRLKENARHLCSCCRKSQVGRRSEVQDREKRSIDWVFVVEAPMFGISEGLNLLGMDVDAGI